uniref:CCHC-type domain-containing protein n=1 Tax=Aotus nancymaae TaxID=37293 RepID=A0A2K5CI99_AOTNA
MTRWARVNTTYNKRPLPATSWEDMKKGSFEGTSQNLPKCKPLEANRLSLKNDAPQAKHKKNNKKKRTEFTDGSQWEVREETAIALKKDSRREGRRLQRKPAKKNAMVCLHCRKPGHGIADCPTTLENQDMGTGICYSCGSTEHEISKCKAKVDSALGEFPFAKCSVCGEMGHLSRACPDNPKGLYADGGGCKLCGSVEHLKKDCPESQNSDRMVTVGRWPKGMSTDYEEILDAPNYKNPKQKYLKVQMNF